MWRGSVSCLRCFVAYRNDSDPAFSSVAQVWEPAKALTRKTAIPSQSTQKAQRVGNRLREVVIDVWLRKKMAALELSLT